MKLNITDVKQGFALNGYIYYREPYKLNIFGLRGYGIDGFHENKYDVFDDTLGISYVDKYGNEQLLFLRVTTDPSTYYFDHLLNVNGVAILSNNQFVDCYKLGYHRGMYEALVQNKNVTVWRKKSPVDYNYKNRQYTGMYGINVHKTVDDIETIGTASAGCLVFNDTEEFNLFLALCHKHKELYGNIFTLTIFEQEDFRGLIQ